jgi:hypothetical protein
MGSEQNRFPQQERVTPLSSFLFDFASFFFLLLVSDPLGGWIWRQIWVAWNCVWVFTFLIFVWFFRVAIRSDAHSSWAHNRAQRVKIKPILLNLLCLLTNLISCRLQYYFKLSSSSIYKLYSEPCIFKRN